MSTLEAKTNELADRIQQAWKGHIFDELAELKADAEVTAALSEAEIEEKFDLGYHTKNVDVIFERVFGHA